MAYTIENLNNFEFGYSKGTQNARKGVPEEELLRDETNPDIIEGIKTAYYDATIFEFRDSLKNLRRSIESKDVSKIQDASYRLLKAKALRVLKIADGVETVKKVSDTEFLIMEDGKPKYKVTKGTNGKFNCTCTGFKYRGKCKHIDMVAAMLNESTERLPQHLARVRDLKKSLAVWEARAAENPDNKKIAAMVEQRRKALEAAQSVAEEIEARPKPQRHPREEFLSVVPSLDKLFEGLGKYEIVGSWRRGKDTYKDCDILTVMSPEQWDELKQRLSDDPNFGPAPGHTHADFGDEVIRGGYKNGDRVDYLDINRVPDPKEWGAWLLFRTGSAQFNIAMRGWLKKFGCGLNERGLIGPDGSVVARESEEDIFNAIGIPFIEPKDREDARMWYRYVRNLDMPKFLGGKDTSRGRNYRVEYTNEDGDSLAVEVEAKSEEQAVQVAMSNYPDIENISSVYLN